MRCANLAETWTELSAWFDRNGVLVLPHLRADGPSVRLDADADPEHAADGAELDRQLDRLKAIVKHFGVRAVYVTRGERMSAVTVRVVADGVVHELMLIADWYAEFLDETIGMAPAHIA
jgi:hypothetical protein